MRDGQGKEWKKKEIHQLWNLTGIGIEQRGLFTKHPMVRSEGKKSRAYRYGWSPLRRLAYCFVTRAGSIESFPSAHAPTTTSAAIQPPLDGNGASPAAVPTPLAGAKSGDFEVEACPVGRTM